MSSYDLDGCDVCILFPFRNAGRQSNSPRGICCIYIWPGSTICRSIWVITVQIMTEELAYSSVIVITMSMNTKSWIFGLTESGDFGMSKRLDSNTSVLISPEIQVKKRISCNLLLPTSPDQ